MNPPTLQQLEHLKRLKIREIELVREDIRSLRLKYRMLIVEIRAIDNRLAEQVKERVNA